MKNCCVECKYSLWREDDVVDEAGGTETNGGGEEGTGSLGVDVVQLVPEPRIGDAHVLHLGPRRTSRPPVLSLRQRLLRRPGQSRELGPIHYRRQHNAKRHDTTQHDTTRHALDDLLCAAFAGEIAAPSSGEGLVQDGRPLSLLGREIRLRHTTTQRHNDTNTSMAGSL